jgi:hypothetical protein
VGFFETVLGLFMRPSVRYAYAALVLLLVGTFVIQQAEALRSVDDLGTRLARRSGSPRADILYSVPLDEAKNIVGSDEFEPLIAATPVRVSNDRLFAQKSDLEPWTQSVSSRFFSRILSSTAPGLDQLPEALVGIQQSITSSLTLRVGGNNP